MANRHGKIDPIIKRAKRLETLGDGEQALELYNIALQLMDKDDPRRSDVETSIAFMQRSGVLTVEPVRAGIWRNVARWGQRWTSIAWGIVAVVLFFGIIILFLGGNLDLRKSGVMALLSGDSQSSDRSLTVPLESQLAPAPTPLASQPTDSPTAEPTSTETFVPSPTALPPTVTQAANSGGGGSPAGSYPTTAPAPGPTSQPAVHPRPVPTSKPGPHSTPGPAGAAGNSNGGNQSGNGKGKGQTCTVCGQNNPVRTLLETVLP